MCRFLKFSDYNSLAKTPFFPYIPSIPAKPVWVMISRDKKGCS